MELMKSEQTAKFVKHADNLKLENLNLEASEWTDLYNFEM
jgi:hypothetical protein